MMSRNAVAAQSLAHDVLVDLLEYSAHQILYHRSVYPSRIFSRCQAFGAPVMKADHSAVRKYIATELRTLRRAMEAGVEVTRVDLALVDSVSGRQMETHVFSMAGPNAGSKGEEDVGLILGELESKCRSLLLTLAARLSEMPQPKVKEGEDPAFVLRFHTDMESAAKLKGEHGWAEVEADNEGGKVIPVHRIGGRVRLETYVIM